jgi:pumilio family protein 6
MPGLKRNRVEEDGLKANGSKKVKADIGTSSKTEKKFALKIAKKEPKSTKFSSSKFSKEKTADAKKSKKPVDSDDLVESDTTEDENGFQGFSASEEQMEGAEDFEDGNDVEDEQEQDLKPRNFANGDAGKGTSVASKLKGSADGANGMFSSSYSTECIMLMCALSDQFT